MRRVPAGRGRSAISSGIAPVWAITVACGPIRPPSWQPTRSGPPTTFCAPSPRFAYSNIGYLLARQALEDATATPLATLLRDRLAIPLGLSSVRLAQSVEDFADLPFAANGYHPGWVAHGCVMGTPTDAVRMLRAILSDPSLAQMQDDRPLSFSDPGRPRTRAGYGLGLMIGDVGSAGRAIGHSGGGPFSANTVYAVLDCPGSPVVACFTSGGNEAPAEHAAVALALRP